MPDKVHKIDQSRDEMDNRHKAAKPERCEYQPMN